MSSPLRWAGGKRRQLAALIRHSPRNFQRYFEPFAGSAALCLALQPQSGLLGDINSELMHFWRSLRDNSEALSAGLLTLPLDRGAYYDIRNRNPNELSPADRAARFLYLNRLAFNGVYRTNRLGHFNVPRGTRTGCLPSTEDLAAAARVLAPIDIVDGDFESSVRRASVDDFVYLDPPYIARGSRLPYGHYTYGSMSRDDDHMRILDVLEYLEKRGAHFLLSLNATSIITDTLVARWHTVETTAYRQVASSASFRSTSVDILAMNYEPHAALHASTERLSAIT